MKYINKDTLRSGVIRLKDWLVGPNVSTSGGSGGGGSEPVDPVNVHYYESTLTSNVSNPDTGSTFIETGLEITFDVANATDIVFFNPFFSIVAVSTVPARPRFRIELDTTLEPEFIRVTATDTQKSAFGFSRCQVEAITGLSAGSHVAKVFWRGVGNESTLLADESVFKVVVVNRDCLTTNVNTGFVTGSNLDLATTDWIATGAEVTLTDLESLDLISFDIGTQIECSSSDRHIDLALFDGTNYILINTAQHAYAENRAGYNGSILLNGYTGTQTFTLVAKIDNISGTNRIIRDLATDGGINNTFLHSVVYKND